MNCRTSCVTMCVESTRPAVQPATKWNPRVLDVDPQPSHRAPPAITSLYRRFCRRTSSSLSSSATTASWGSSVVACWWTTWPSVIRPSTSSPFRSLICRSSARSATSTVSTATRSTSPAPSESHTSSRLTRGLRCRPGQGVGSALGRTDLSQTRPFRRPSAACWPRPIPAMHVTSNTPARRSCCSTSARNMGHTGIQSAVREFGMVQSPWQQGKHPPPPWPPPPIPWLRPRSC